MIIMIWHEYDFMHDNSDYYKGYVCTQYYACFIYRTEIQKWLPFAWDMFKCIFVNRFTLIQISYKCKSIQTPITPIQLYVMFNPASLTAAVLYFASISREMITTNRWWRRRRRREATVTAIRKSGTWRWGSLQWRHNGRYGVSNRQPRDWFTQPFIQA